MAIKDDKGELIAVFGIKRSGITKLKRVPFPTVLSISGDFRDDSPHVSRSLTLIRSTSLPGTRFINAIKTLGQARICSGAMPGPLSSTLNSAPCGLAASVR